LQQDEIIPAPKVRGHFHKDFPIEPFLVETDAPPIFHVLEKSERNRVDGALRLARSGAPGDEPAAHKILHRPRQPTEPENYFPRVVRRNHTPHGKGQAKADHDKRERRREQKISGQRARTMPRLRKPRPATAATAKRAPPGEQQRQSAPR
jgi:hypothetical protein